MNRLTQPGFQTKDALFVPYMMSGDPTMDASTDIAVALQEAGADALEWGVPFSDPLADGPVIQEAGKRAQKTGGNLPQALAGMKEARKKGLHIPAVLFTYVNPVLTYGVEALIHDMKESGFDGILIPDLPYEESTDWREKFLENGLSLVPLIAPSSQNRTEKISKSADGFLYYVTSLGVTGERTSFSEKIADDIAAIQNFTEVPVLAGFGITTNEHVRHFQSIADGAIVGSAIVKEIGKEEEALLDSRTRADAVKRIKSFVEALISY
ncbi:tryptophan synthase subunit alpha [Salisediminibacterium halotolerans]|uniref:tryptophan synthase subunit alpha n=1 Tax=Salisediminibacterium halotolerans TaxID=517425 RepID=UPI000EB27FC4|nr:tryptophan synthase subunit alpha [Salisediminibacterium halotolerans]RLJ77934.1 tryptophan synthase alpha chain [Actinophytocola xinjiangensis]RPE88728.1 tryptophan synthase alpha chain [Salisediminibacterium halotolerans]TWG36911.1 tryptophan synthase alpha chain [Salisediminibacterium halotolerans]GEL07403.1 tryptophan synthase alpha chain [Salisediminibacterium halotolerans]